MRRYRQALLSMHLLLLVCGLHAQDELSSDEAVRQIMEELFEVDEPLALELQVDLKTFQRTRNEGEYHPAEMKLFPEDSMQITRPVRIKARGIFRRKHCQLPPFWLNIRYAGIDAENFSGIRRIKVVPRCKSSRSYDDYVLREYLVYRLYEELTPISFRTRLVHLKIVDTGSNMHVQEDWAFLIEPVDMLARRLDADEIKDDELAMRRVNNEVMDQLAMFQFMIGNSDYSVTGRHNLKIFQVHAPGNQALLPVPYDFDFTGMVNTMYSFPREGLPIESTRERYFQGPCRSMERHLALVDSLRAREDRFLEVLMNFPYLEEKERKEMADYMESFFSEAAREDFFRRRITGSCR